MSFIGLSTCPHHASGNVGDQLITDTAIELIEDIHGPTEFDVHFYHEDFTSRLDYLNNADGIIIFGFGIKESKIRSSSYRIAEYLDDVEPPIIPISGIHNFFPGDERALNNRKLESSTKSFLDRIVPNCPDEKIPVRTEWVGKMLRNNGYQAILTGDPAWYDPDYLGDEFHKPDSIEQLVFTTPHYSLYIDQAKKLIKSLTNTFPDAKRIVSLHSVPTDVDRELSDIAKNAGWEIRYTSHDVENLEFYRESDLHVGYRKHGHLAHLRWRRPSIVLAEDSRSQGLNETFGTAGFPAFRPRKGIFRQLGNHYNSIPVRGMYRGLQELGYGSILPHRLSLVAPPNPTAVDDILGFIQNQQENDWEEFTRVKDIIDRTYRDGMEPFLRSALSL